jgi:hypothetical protein
MRLVTILIAGATAAFVAGGARGQCTTIDFENFANGTEITTQYAGVTFSAPPGSCGGMGSVKMVIVQPSGGTSSGTKSLGIQTGCPDFSPDHLRMVFDEPQRVVSFTMGEQVSTGITFTVAAYRSNDTLIGGDSMVVGEGVHRLVSIGDAEGTAQIARIEVEALGGFFECIDDLSFNADPTPPEVRIDSPAYGDCLCGPTVTLTGITCDDDGGYDRDLLEYRPVGAAPGTPWTFVQEYVGTPVCTAGSLYTWDVSAIAHGRYYLRITAFNDCGMSASDVIDVFIDKTFGTVAVTSPVEQEEVCGVVTMEGTIDDHCGACFVEYTVKYAQMGHPESLVPVDPAHPTYTTPVRNGTLAVWDTEALGVPTGGVYMLRFEGIDECGNSKLVDRLVLLGDCPCPEDLDESGAVDFPDLLRILSLWGPCP